MKKLTSAPLNSRGFALVVTLSLMILLTLVAVGLLSLSAVSMRTGSQAKSEAEAKANARLALMIAIGELQKQMGPDQRVSANGAIIQTTSPKNPHWLGVWNSWKAGDGTSFHRSVEGESLMGMAPTYQPGRSDYFRSWLLSLNPGEAQSISSPMNVSITGNSMPGLGATAVELVGKGSLGEAAAAQDYVSARLLSLKAPTGTIPAGRYGWWVGDESQKARIMSDSYLASSTSLKKADKIFRAQAPGSTGTTAVTGLQNISNDGQLTGLPSLQSLDLIDANPERASGDPDPADNFHHVTAFSEGVIADVREGGLKRDLSALLERKIDPAEVDANPNEFSLYKFNTKDNWALQPSNAGMAPQECVPIQDLAAYYQLYDAVSPEAAAQDPLRVSNNRGVRYTTDSSPSKGGMQGIHMLTTDFGRTSNSPIYPTAHSSIYRQPKIIKIQFVAHMSSKLIEPPIPSDRSNPNPNTHELLIGITPAITFWNPTNVPVVFQKGDPYLTSQMLRFSDTPIQIRFNKNNGQNITGYTGMSALTATGGFGAGGDICNLYWGGFHPISLEPGEVKTLSLPYSGDLSTLKSLNSYNGHWNQAGNMKNFWFKTDTWFIGHEVKVGWEPETFIHFDASATAGANNGTAPATPTSTDARHVVDNRLRFKATDRIQVEIGSGGNASMGWTNNSSSYQDFNAAWTNWDRSNGCWGMRGGAGVAFYQPLFQKGMTNGAASLLAASRTGSSIIARSSTDEGWPFMHFAILAGVETSETSNGGFAGGRKFPSRPFLHSSTIHSYPFLDNSTGNDLYNFGWNWTVDLLNDVYEAPVQLTDTGSSYWGGGYTPESGTTHIIQQEIPIVPPISIAALSHARLGGWSISDQLEMAYGTGPGQMSAATATRMRNMSRAVGFGGLRPHTQQAIGNSYAHPQIPAGQTYITVSRTYNTADGSFNETFADHSYLANKALWDEFFFSSITPQRAEVKIFESADQEAADVAKDFFFDSKTLPNRRIKPYKANINQSKLTGLFAQKDVFTGGLADKIASHLVVDGPFNINSTSVEAWKVLFSSLKGKPVAYLEGAAAMSGSDPSVSTSHTGTPIGQVGLAGGPTYSGSPNTPPNNTNQWTGWRELTDDEIEELAHAMVKQVKLRGPFLSLSEFVNRRLEGNTGAAGERSAKGALQAALDDPDYPTTDLADADGQKGVAINAAFRTADRKFSSTELSSMSPAFSLAAEGPVAYGSPAYIDQADILRGFAEQLTPRGDTFVIRTYGDSLDTQGKVQARAWCEAVVQRLPDYVDGSDDPSEKPSDNTAAFSTANKTFGRKLQLVSFRWLNPTEV